MFNFNAKFRKRCDKNILILSEKKNNYQNYQIRRSNFRVRNLSTFRKSPRHGVEHLPRKIPISTIMYRHFYNPDSEEVNVKLNFKFPT